MRSIWHRSLSESRYLSRSISWLRLSFTVFRRIAKAGIAYTQCSVDENLKLNIGNTLVDGPYLCERKLASQHRAPYAKAPQPLHLLRRTVIGLRRSVQGYGDLLWMGCQMRQKAHVLNQYGIHADLLKLFDESRSLPELAVIDNRVYRYIDPGTEEMGIPAQLGYVVETVASRRTCAKPARTDIHGIGSVVYCSLSAGQILGGSKQFNVSHQYYMVSPDRRSSLSNSRKTGWHEPSTSPSEQVPGCCRCNS